MAFAYRPRFTKIPENQEKVLPELLAFLAEHTGGNVIDSQIETLAPLTDKRINDLCYKAEVDFGCKIELKSV